MQDNSMKDLRQRIMGCLLLMTEEFTTRSIKSARESQNATSLNMKRSISREEVQNDEKRIDEINALSNVLSWSSSNHLLVMFHEDGMCVTPVYREAYKVPAEIKGLMESQKSKLEDYQSLKHHEILTKLLNITGKQFIDTLFMDNDYVLTADYFS